MISFAASLRHNGLAYGNGGIKIWPRHMLRTLRTHEASRDGALAVDFAWRIPYVQARGTPSETVVTGSPLQAFRAGLREGVRLIVHNGDTVVARHPDLPPAEALARHLPSAVLDRLRIWCSVGSDIENGDFAILGARMGCVMAALDGFDIARIADFDWIAQIWEDQVAPATASARAREAESIRLGIRMNNELGLAVEDLGAAASSQARSAYRAPARRLGMLSPG